VALATGKILVKPLREVGPTTFARKLDIGDVPDRESVEKSGSLVTRWECVEL